MGRDESRPIDPKTKAPLDQREQPGYFPGFKTLGQQDFWDATTRSVILDRVHNVPQVRFFQGDEVASARALFDRLIPQEDRDPAFRIPVLNHVDDRLQQNRLDGYRYEGMPTDQDAYRLGLKGIDEIARHLHGQPFAECTVLQQEEVLATIHDGNPPAGEDIWAKMPVERFWLLIMQDAVEAYYAHPWSWDEIGFGGPAYPRAYFRLNRGEAEPWEVDEVRYEWEAPPNSPSAGFQPVGGREHHHAPPGQEGTH